MFSTKHKPYKYGFDISKPPDVPQHLPPGQKAQFLPSSDESLWLFSRSWELPPEHNHVAKATLIICHGTVDHSGVYHDLAKALVKHGIAVFAQDMRGWGLSDGEDMYMNDIETFVEDVDHFYEEIHKRPEYASVTHRFILGKSIGGLISAYSVLRHPHKYAGLIGLSGAYMTHPDRVVSPMLEEVLQATNALGGSKLPVKQVFDPSLIVKDEDALKKWYEDPLCSKSKVRVGYAVEALRCQRELPTLVCDIDTPMFMMIGEDDKVVSRKGLEMMVNCKKKEHWDYYMMPPHCQSQIKIYDGGRHNLLAEPTLKEKVIDDIKNWILHRIVCDSGCNVAQ